MQVDQPLVEMEAGEVHVKEEEDDEDELMMLDQIESAIRTVEAEEKAAGNAAAEEEVGTAGEATIGAGLAGALAVLRRTGLLATPSADQVERERIQKQRDTWLAEQRHRISQREE